MAEVAKHNNDKDCWVAINGNVYDLTRYMSEHPGGENSILDVAGQDATYEFDAADHPQSAMDEMKKFLIGMVISTPKGAHSSTSKTSTSIIPGAPKALGDTELAFERAASRSRSRSRSNNRGRSPTSPRGARSASKIGSTSKPVPPTPQSLLGGNLIKKSTLSAPGANKGLKKVPRSKVQLGEGHSQANWMNKKMPTVQLRRISKEELRQHRKPEDPGGAWMALKGKVYDVTSYMDFHPGGREKIIQACGQVSECVFFLVGCFFFVFFV